MYDTFCYEKFFESLQALGLNYKRYNNFQNARYGAKPCRDNISKLDQDEIESLFDFIKENWRKK